MFLGKSKIPPPSMALKTMALSPITPSRSPCLLLFCFFISGHFSLLTIVIPIIFAKKHLMSMGVQFNHVLLGFIFDFKSHDIIPYHKLINSCILPAFLLKNKAQPTVHPDMQGSQTCCTPS